ncbi:MAG: hypothetical protein Q8K59_00705 [Nitrosomonas sp.]|nr:hypothetical protein [Nitrosomonas sp.]MDP1949622.1 hypothetical protein [Nitrosomonas sp.]
MVTKRGKQASHKAAARKYGFLEVPRRTLEYVIDYLKSQEAVRE